MSGIIRTRPGSEVKEYIQKIGNDTVYGNGSDGTVVISNTGTPTVITRDMYYDSLTVNSSCTLITNGFRVFVKGTLTNNGTIGATVGYTTAISDGTVAGQSSTVETYSLSQTSTNPVALSLLNELESAITGYYVDNAATVRQFRGGDIGAAGTGAGAGGAGGTGADGNIGTGANAGTAGAPGFGATAGTNGIGATGGQSGAGLPANSHYAHAGSNIHYHFHSPNSAAGSGNGGTNGVGNPGTNGAAGNHGNSGTNGPKGLAGNPGNAGNAGSNGVGGAGGPIVLIVAKTISGAGTIISVGQSGTSGVAGNAGNIGTGATSGNAGAAGNIGTGATAGVAGNATAGAAGNTGAAGNGYVSARDNGHHNAGNPTGSTANHGFGPTALNSSMRTYGGQGGRPANESNQAIFPRHAHRSTSHAFHWTGAPSTLTWPRFSVPSNVAHFAIGLAHTFVSGHNPNTGHNATLNAGHGPVSHTFTLAGGAGGSAGNAGTAGAAGNAGNNGAAGLAGNPGNPGNNGAAGLAGTAGNAGASGKDGGIIIVTDSWNLAQTLSSSTKVLINS